MPDNQIDLSQLEKDTNAEFGEGEPTQEPAVEPVESSTQAAEIPEPAPTDVAPQAALPQSQAVNYEEQWRSLGETPFKSVPDLVKGYKEIQSRASRVEDKVKPYEQLFDRFGSDTGFRTYLQQAAQAYDNPQLLEAYAKQGEPDITHYDLLDPKGLESYQKDFRAHLERSVDSRINVRLSQIEQQAALERARFDFKSKYPNENADEVISYAKSRGGNWSLEDVYKIKNFDSVRSLALEEARKELTKQIETAQKTATPVTSAAPRQQVNVNDILAHISKFGSESAFKKFSKQRVEQAMSESAFAY